MDKAKIMVVEDERIVARDLARQLGDLGYDVVATAYSGEEAVEKVGEVHPDLVLMDIVLAGKMDGIQAAEKITTLSAARRWST
jgi:CheY-like chemotaxis protein